MKPFWMVFGEGGRAPARKHETRESAAREAERLAMLNPKRTFTVLKAETAHIHRPVETFAYDDPDDMAHLAGAAALFDARDPDIPF